MSRKHARIAGAAVLTVLLTGLIAYAVGQPPIGNQGGGGQFNPMMAFRGPRGGGGAAIAVTGDAVFVVANGWLLKYDPGTLELIAQAELPEPPAPAGGALPGQ